MKKVKSGAKKNKIFPICANRYFSVILPEKTEKIRYFRRKQQNQGESAGNKKGGGGAPPPGPAAGVI